MHRRHRPALSLAAVLTLGLALTGCAVDDGGTEAALQSAEERLSQAERRIQELEDQADRTVDVGELGDRAQAAVDDLGGQADQALKDLQSRAEPLSELSVDQLKDVRLPELEGLPDLSLDAEGAVEDLMRGLPSGPDMADVEAVKDQGRVIVGYWKSALDADPAVLEQAMREAAEKAKESVPDLKDVEFRVGDQTFTF